MKIIVISDTHIPVSAKSMPEALLKDIASADMILHAGDLMEIGVLNELKKLKPTEAVAGNMDSPEIKKRLDTKKIISVGNVKIGLVHGWGAPYQLIDSIKNEFKNIKDISCVVYGHSHTASIDTIDGVIYFNPGSPTDKIFAPYNSYGVLEIKNNKITPRIVKI